MAQIVDCTPPKNTFSLPIKGCGVLPPFDWDDPDLCIKDTCIDMREVGFNYALMNDTNIIVKVDGELYTKGYTMCNDSIPTWSVTYRFFQETPLFPILFQSWIMNIPVAMTSNIKTKTLDDVCRVMNVIDITHPNWIVQLLQYPYTVSQTFVGAVPFNYGALKYKNYPNGHTYSEKPIIKIESYYVKKGIKLKLPPGVHIVTLFDKTTNIQHTGFEVTMPSCLKKGTSIFTAKDSEGNPVPNTGIPVDSLNFADPSIKDNVPNAEGFTNWVNNNTNMGELLKCYNLDCFMNPTNLQSSLDSMSVDSLIAQYPNLTAQQIVDAKKYIYDKNKNVSIDDLFRNIYAPGTTKPPCPELADDGNDIDPEGRNSGAKALGKEKDVDLFNAPGLDKGANIPSVAKFTPTIEASTNLYNGNPSINIPLHTLVANDISVPVGLSYTATGVKINDLGTEMGTNWTLNNGGAITRSVNGLPDEFDDVMEGHGMEMIPKFDNVTLNITGVGVVLGTCKKVYWGISRINRLSFRINIFTGVIPFLQIPVYSSIEISAEINLRYTLDEVNYVKRGLGIQHLNEKSTVSRDKYNDFDVEQSVFSIFRRPVKNDIPKTDLGKFETMSKNDKELILRHAAGVSSSLNDTKFLLSPFAQYFDFWKGLTNNFKKATIKSKSIDVQPDDFYYNFGNYSGKFMIDQQGNIRTMPASDLVITRIQNTNNAGVIEGFKATTPEGLTYVFGSGEGGSGIEMIENTNYTLPNDYTYPECKASNQFVRKDFGKAEIFQNESTFQFSAFQPGTYLFGSTYDSKYRIMPGPLHASKWHLVRIESKITDESVSFTYMKRLINYYSSKTLTHTYPNFGVNSSLGGEFECGKTHFETEWNKQLNPIHFFPTEWRGGKASLVYSVTETTQDQLLLKQIDSQRGEKIIFEYGEDRPDLKSIPIDYKDEKNLCTRIVCQQNSNFNKAWKFTYNSPRIDITNNIIANCISVPSSIFTELEPPYSMPNEFKLDLGKLNSKVIFPRLKFMEVYLKMGTASAQRPKPYFTVTKPIKFSHYKTLSELGSLLVVKSLHLQEYNKVLTPQNFADESEKFLKENGRAFLIKIDEQGRDQKDYDFAEFTYYGTPSLLPKRFSFQQDLWGYYNNNTNTILPFTSYISVTGKWTSNPAGHFGFSNSKNASTTGGNMSSGQNEAGDITKCSIGAIRTIKVATGASYTYNYELNDWINYKRSGAGLRVKSYIKNSGDGLNNLTTYEYRNGTYANLPVRSSMNPYNLTDYGLDWDGVPKNIENFIITSSAPLNRWLMNKSNYIGYNEVIENHPSIGSIKHTFIAPKCSPLLIFEQ